MPIYSYKCEACSAVVELLSNVSKRDDEMECDACKKGKLVRLVDQSSFALKGGGWNSDGYSTIAPSEKG